MAFKRRLQAVLFTCLNKCHSFALSRGIGVERRMEDGGRGGEGRGGCREEEVVVPCGWGGGGGGEVE